MAVAGIDISDYALEHAKEEVRGSLRYGQAQEIPFGDNEFDLVISLAALHNLKVYDLKKAVREIERVSKGNICRHSGIPHIHISYRHPNSHNRTLLQLLHTPLYHR